MGDVNALLALKVTETKNVKVFTLTGFILYTLWDCWDFPLKTCNSVWLLFVSDIDECKERTACQCSGCKCKNTWGSYECNCRGDLLYMKEHDTCISEYILYLCMPCLLFPDVFFFFFFSNKYSLIFHMPSINCLTSKCP